MRNDYNVAIYCRYSKDDGKIEDSSSIKTQKEMLTKYVREQPNWTLFSVYSDDGIFGLSTENRPEFQRMMRDIDSGKVNLILTKDASRLNRNYLEAGMLIECVFPSKGVRYIALNDGIDTDNQMGMDIAPFKNILNEFYSRDISKKVSSAKKTRFLQGKFMGGIAPFGYKKDPNDKNHLLIDEEYAPIIKKIFDLYLQGLGIQRIKNVLNEEKIIRPGAVTYANTATFDRWFDGTDDPNCRKWSNNSVRNVLENPVYAGHLAGYKRPQIPPQCKSRPSKLPEDWLVVKNTHEPIIDPEVFETVQLMIRSRRRKGKSGYDNIFSHLIKCADCGYCMCASQAHRKLKENPVENIDYYWQLSLMVHIGS